MEDRLYVPDRLAVHLRYEPDLVLRHRLLQLGFVPSDHIDLRALEPLGIEADVLLGKIERAA